MIAAGAAGRAGRSGGGPPPTPDRHRAGRLRRGDDRHDAPVLPAGADRARRGGRQRTGRHAGREPRRSCRRGGRRPVRPRLRPRPTPGPPIFTRAAALELGRAAIGNPQARLEPAAAEPGSTPARRRPFAAGRPHRGRPAQAAARVARLRRPAQPGRRSAEARGRRGPGPDAGHGGRSCWSTSSRTPTRSSGRCCERAFAGHATLVLIGDPKQAIYAFRGGDVTTYLAAARTAQTQRDAGAELAQRRAAGRGAARDDRRRRARRPGHRGAAGLGRARSRPTCRRAVRRTAAVAAGEPLPARCPAGVEDPSREGARARRRRSCCRHRGPARHRARSSTDDRSSPATSPC